MPGPSQGRKPGDRTREKGGGSRKHEDKITAEQRSAIDEVRNFGIGSSEVSDSRIIEWLEKHPGVDSLIDDFYNNRGQLPDEFETVKKKEKKKKGPGDRTERPERRDYERPERGEKRAEPRPKTDDRKNKPQPRPAQVAKPAAAPAAAAAQESAQAPPRGAWGNQQGSSSQPSWGIKSEPVAAPAPAPAPVPEPVVVAPKPSLGGAKSWAQITKPKSPPPRPAPAAEPPIRQAMAAERQKRQSPPPSPQLDSDPSALVDKIRDLTVDTGKGHDSPGASEPEQAAPVTEHPKPVSIGDPAKSYSVPAPQSTTSVWGAAPPAVPSLSTKATPFEPPAQGPPPSIGQASPQQQQQQQQQQRAFPGAYDAGPSSGPPFVGQPQPNQFGAHGNGFMSSLASGNDESKDMTGIGGINFGWGIGAADETTSSSNGVSSYGSAPAVDMAQAKPRPPAKAEGQEQPEYPTSSAGMEHPEAAPQAAFMNYASHAQAAYGFPDPQMYAGGADLSAQYGVQQADYGATAAGEESEQAPAPSQGGRYKGQKGNKHQAQAHQAAQAQQHMPYYPQPMPQQFAGGMPGYYQPYAYGYQFPQQGQFQQPQQAGQFKNMQGRQQAAYAIPAQAGFGYPQQGYPYQAPGAGQEGQAGFDYSQHYGQQAGFVPPAPVDAASAAGGDKAASAQDMNAAQAAMYQQQQQFHGYPQSGQYYGYHMHQPTAQQFQQQQQPPMNQYYAAQ